MAVRQRLLVLLALTLALALAPAVAQAAVTEPVFTPKVLISEGFETVPSTQYAVSSDAGASQWWGRTSYQKKTGSYGMWVAGSPKVPTSASLTYAEQTGGLLSLTPSESLANYYSSEVSFQLIQPSLGFFESAAGGNDAYGLLLKAKAPAAAFNRLLPFKTVLASWSAQTANLSDPAAGDNNLSRTAGTVWFAFKDGDEAVQTPRVGIGPTIDDVVLRGWKYGPVRTLSAAIQAGDDVKLDFKRPLRTTADTTVTDERALVYRIWRTETGVAPYTDVSGSPDGIANGATDVSVLDPIVAEGVTMTYVVQAWDPASGAGYGQPSTTQVAIPSNPPAITMTAPTSTSAATDGVLTIAGTATDVGSGIATVTVSVKRAAGQYFNGSTWVTSPTPIQLATTYSAATGQWSRTIPSAAADIAYTVTATAQDVAGLKATRSATTRSHVLAYSAGANGTVSGTLSQQVAYGSSGTTVTAVPDTGYHFVTWSDGVTTASRIEKNVTADKAASASFAINVYSLDYQAGPNGSLVGTAHQSVTHGASGTSVTAIAQQGYRFVSWSDGVSSATRQDVNVTQNLNLTANFVAVEIPVFSVAYRAGQNGTITGSSDQRVAQGSAGTTVTATPSTGYHFVVWSDGLATAARRDGGIAADATYTASFAINTYTLTYTAGAGGSLLGTSSQAVDHGSAATTVTAVPATGYHFVGWSDGVQTAARRDVGVTGDASCSAEFAINAYTLAYVAGTGGALSGSVTQTVDHGGAATAITAVPASGYHFVKWSDGRTTPTRQDTGISADATHTATFARTLKYASITRSPNVSSKTYTRKKGVARYTLYAAVKGWGGAPYASRWVYLQSSKDGKKWTAGTYKIKTSSTGKVSKAFTIKSKQVRYYRWYVPATSQVCLATYSPRTKITVK